MLMFFSVTDFEKTHHLIYLLDPPTHRTVVHTPARNFLKYLCNLSVLPMVGLDFRSIDRVTGKSNLSVAYDDSILGGITSSMTFDIIVPSSVLLSSYL